MHITALHHQLPEELMVIRTTGHAAGHSHDSELGLPRRSWDSAGKLLG